MQCNVHQPHRWAWLFFLLADSSWLSQNYQTSSHYQPLVAKGRSWRLGEATKTWSSQITRRLPDRWTILFSFCHLLCFLQTATQPCYYLTAIGHGPAINANFMTSHITFYIKRALLVGCCLIEGWFSQTLTPCVFLFTLDFILHFTHFTHFTNHITYSRTPAPCRPSTTPIC